MKKNIFYPIIFIYFLISLHTFLAAKPLKPLNVVVSVPDIADMVTEIGGDKVKVISLSTGMEDLHFVPVKPSFIPKLFRADILITLGLDAEHAWLPALTEASRNPSIFPDKPGWIELSKGITALKIPTQISRIHGEQHPAGNPHFNIGPTSGFTMASNIYLALVEKRPQFKDIFTDRLSIYIKALQDLITELKQKSKPLENIPVISYHDDIAYLCQFYDLISVGELEVKPGIPPIIKHLQNLKKTAIQKEVKIVLCSQGQDARLSRKFAKDIGAKFVQIYNLVGAKKEVDSWVKLQKYNLQQILKAIE